MTIYPAIDLLDGRCVRLMQGRYDRVIAYDDDPLDVARRFRGEGAVAAHIIDLDGARQGSPANVELVRKLVAETGLRVEYGGGIRDIEHVRQALDAGVETVIIGARALSDWKWFQGLVRQSEYAGRLALGLDARMGKLVVKTTRTGEALAASDPDAGDAPTTVAEVCHAVAGWPLAGIVYTDLALDGLMLGPNLDGIRQLASTSPVPVVYCGGVADLDDVRRLADLDLSGIAIGRALYEGLIDFKSAVNVVEQAGA